jgi:hypothetical protein
MTRKQYYDLMQEADRLRSEHRGALRGLTSKDWQREPLSPKCKRASELYAQLSAIDERLEEVHSSDVEFDEDWADIMRPQPPEAA